MYIRILLLVALVHSWKLTTRQNEHLKKHCGARLLGKSPQKMGKVPYKKLPIDLFEIYIGSRNVHPEMGRNNSYKIGKAQFGDLDPCYDPHGDLAIIELDRDIPAEEGTPICMPKRNETLQKKLTAVGYGVTPKTGQVKYFATLLVFCFQQIRPNPNGTVLNYLQSVSVDFANVTEANKVFTTITKGRSICR
ncbi:hypothetical protein COOONC_10210, partial [Cooperia oncophora]